MFDVTFSTLTLEVQISVNVKLRMTVIPIQHYQFASFQRPRPPFKSIVVDKLLKLKAVFFAVCFMKDINCLYKANEGQHTHTEFHFSTSAGAQTATQIGIMV